MKKHRIDLLNILKYAMVIVLLVYIGFLLSQEGGKDVSVKTIRENILAVTETKGMTKGTTQDLKKYYGLNANDYEGVIDEFDRIIGLEKGSDDYITKPFSPKELVLRVNNIIKRVYKDDNKIMVDGYEIDSNQRTVHFEGKQIDLTTKEFDLLMMFVNNRGKAFPREKILEQVWEENYFGSDRVVDDTLRRLRKKMPNLSIKTIYGFGYKLG